MSDKKIKKHPLTHRQLKNKLSNHKTLHKITKNKKFYSLKKLNNTSKRLLLTRIKKKRKKLRLVKKVGYKKINRIILNIPSNQRQSLKKITHTNKLLKRVNKSKKSIIFSYLFKNKVRKNQLIRRKKRRKFK
jgi:hypothetical protein